MFNWILSWFKSGNNNPKETAEGEVVEPLKFKYAESNKQSVRPKEESDQLYKKFKLVEREKQYWIANNTNDKVIQESILASGDEELIGYLLLNKWLDEDLQFKIATSIEFSSHVLRSILARKVGLALGVQEILAKDKKPEVRRMLARWQRPINPTIATILIKDSDLEVRKSVARNIGEKIKVENMLCFSGHISKFQEILVRDMSPEVRMELTLNSNLRPKVQLSLVEECYLRKEWENLISFAKNVSIDKAAREKIVELLEDQNNFNARLVLKTLSENRPVTK